MKSVEFIEDNKVPIIGTFDFLKKELAPLIKTGVLHQTV